MAMVPFADLFNHKPAIVQLGGGYFVENVCFEGQDSSDAQDSDDPDDLTSDSDGAIDRPDGSDGDDAAQQRGSQQPQDDNTTCELFYKN